MIFFAMLAIKVLRPLCEHFLFIQIEKNSHFSISSHCWRTVRILWLEERAIYMAKFNYKL